MNNKNESKTKISLNGLGGKLNKPAKLEFPIHVFPMEIQRVIHATSHALNYPKDFTSVSILYAASVAVGQSVKAHFKTGFEVSAVIYAAIVGRSGTMKTHPLKFALEVLHDKDAADHAEYKKLLKEFNKLAKLTKKELQATGLLELPEPPVLRQRLMSDFTMEALIKAHNENIRGLGIYSDELATWFKNFNRYNTGSEEENWLQNWSGAPMVKNRVTTDAIRVDHPFVSVMGGIQPAVIKELAEGRLHNGFMSRILFAYPIGLEMQEWNDNLLDSTATNEYHSVITKLSDIHLQTSLHDLPQPEVIGFSADAKAVLMDYQKVIVKKSKEARGESYEGIFAKLDVYMLRLAFLLELLKYGASDKGARLKSISKDSANGAVEMVKFFEASAISVYELIEGLNPVNELPKNKREFYYALPVRDFKTSEAVDLGKKFDLKERAVKAMLPKEELFEKVKHGVYTRLYFPDTE